MGDDYDVNSRPSCVTHNASQNKYDQQVDLTIAELKTLLNKYFRGVPCTLNILTQAGFELKKRLKKGYLQNYKLETCFRFKLRT